MRVPSNRFPVWLLTPLLPWFVIGPLSAQETESPASETAEEEVQTISPLDDEGRLVRFERDIAPILRTRCLECHGPDDAKGDFRVDDVDTLMQYVEPEDIESSTLYTDNLLSEDEDTLMPPSSHEGPLSTNELALIRVWIEEGAHWPDGFELKAEESSDEAADATQQAEAKPPATLGERVWTAQGYLHPATVHFPIAFFLLGGLFVVLGWKWPSVGTQIPLACLLLGSVSAVAASAMGWAFAPEQGWGNAWARFDFDKEIDMHRWSGVIVAVVSVIVAITALTALWKDSESLTKYWKIGLLVLAGMVGAVGHQGGELSYGSDFYQKAYDILMGPGEQGEQVAAVGDPSEDAQVDENPSDSEEPEVASEDSGAANDTSGDTDGDQDQVTQAAASATEE